jgi:hypothetical protein
MAVSLGEGREGALGGGEWGIVSLGWEGCGSHPHGGRICVEGPWL